jgi:hypothetical protein
MSEAGGLFKNEVSLNGQFLLKNDDLHGGHSFEIVNRSKFSINSRVDFTASVGFELATELTIDDDTTLNNSSMYSFGGDLNLHPSKGFTVRFSMLRTYENGVEETQGFEADLDRDQLTTSISLTNRF